MREGREQGREEERNKSKGDSVFFRRRRFVFFNEKSIGPAQRRMARLGRPEEVWLGTGLELWDKALPRTKVVCRAEGTRFRSTREGVGQGGEVADTEEAVWTMRC